MYQTINIIRRLRAAGLQFGELQYDRAASVLRQVTPDVHTAVATYLERRSAAELYAELTIVQGEYAPAVLSRLIDKAVAGATTPLEVYQPEDARPRRRPRGGAAAGRGRRA